MNRDTLKGIVVGALIVCLALGVHWLVQTQRTLTTAVKSIDAYIGACQRSGALPTVEQLNAGAMKVAPAPAAKDAKK